MTREEAIICLQGLLDNPLINKGSYLAQAIEMAIQALSQEPTDAISRDAALEKMADYVASGYADSAEDFEEYSRIICQLPSVTQKSGKWILLDECANSGYYCSNCQKKLVKEGWSQTVKKIKYCPNCGAKMESEVRNEADN